MKDFIRPSTGLIDVTVCAKSGLLPTSYCNEGTITLTFLEGTQPQKYCDIHDAGGQYTRQALDIMMQDSYHIDDTELQNRLKLPTLDMNSLPSAPPASTPSSVPPANTTNNKEDAPSNPLNQEYNPLLD